MSSSHASRSRAFRARSLSLSLAAALLLTSGLATGETTTSAPAAPAAKAKPATMQEILDASTSADWRPLDPENTLYLELASGRVVMELAPDFSPNHAKNIRALVRENYFDGLSIIRSQDNFVVQWGDPNSGEEGKEKAIKTGQKALGPEFTRPMKGLPFHRIPDVDGWAPQVGFANGLPAARNPKTGQAWLAHCYGMVGAGRGATADSGGGTELYVVIGQAPRQLDRNITLVGRVVQGMELLSVLPRGTGPLGFYEKPEQYTPIKAIRLAADLPQAERTNLEVFRTDTPTFDALVEARRNRKDDWYLVKAGHIDLCNVPIPVRPIETAKPAEAKTGR